PRRPRARGADASARKCLVMDADDEAVLNLIAECEWDLSNPPGSSSASQKEHETGLSGSQESRQLLSPPPVQHQHGDSTRQGPDKRAISSRSCRAERTHQSCGEGPPRRGAEKACHACRPHAHAALRPVPAISTTTGSSSSLLSATPRSSHGALAPGPFLPSPSSSARLCLCADSTDAEDSASSQKSSLLTQKAFEPLPVSEKHGKQRMPGRRFQVPSDHGCLSCLEGTHRPPSPEESPSRWDSSGGRSERTFSRSGASEMEEQRLQGPTDAQEVRGDPGQASAPPGKKAAREAVLLEALLDLVDTNRASCQSLHSSKVFPAQARHVFSSVQERVAAQDMSTAVSDEMRRLALENQVLQRRLLEQQPAPREDVVASELDNTQRELDDVRQRLDEALEENSSLKSLLFSMRKEIRSADASATLTLQITELQTSVKRLSGEIVELKQHLEHYDRIQELTQMLQESHSSLVSTNEHLLGQLSQARARHQAEMEQMHWSYQELKRTMAQFPHSGTSLATRQPCNP
ncbi:centrosomal protein of 72 kDa, partial [Carlito syrichta]|uniref:Centrosomal protein of 72 kDa n=1 Tax=Carlito syrichta TaxID=1868482 RepID=A0A3Q0E3F7_CARSF